jgi:hypothetical protein
VVTNDLPVQHCLPPSRQGTNTEINKDMASSKNTSQLPPHAIEESMRGRSQLARDYWGFLSSVDPIKRWQDITVLKEPIATSKSYPDLLEKERILRDYYPSLLHQVVSARDWGEMAQHLGFRYAWTRLLMHAAILDVLSDRYPVNKPSLVVEPGCFCSGLIHYLPTAWGVDYTGFDLSPVALDVCRALATKHGISDRVRLHSGNFLQLSTGQFAETTNHSLDSTLILLTNFFSSIHNDWLMYPCLCAGNGWIAYATLVAYWADAGATVVLCERHEDPEWIQEAMTHFGTAITTNLHYDLAATFETSVTTNMTPANPIGDWETAKSFVAIVRKTS